MHASIAKSSALLSLLVLSTAASAANRPPVISGVPAGSVQVQKTYRFFAAARDADGNAVSFSIANKPAWAWFDARAGILGGEPQVAGTYSNIIISATDGMSTVSLPAFSITATSTAAPTNRAPTISGTPVATVQVQKTYRFAAAASDADGDALSFSIANKPSWAWFDARTGLLGGEPQAAGVYSNIIVSASDGKTSASLPAFSITAGNVAATPVKVTPAPAPVPVPAPVVTPANRAPAISGVPATSVQVQKTYRFFAVASDPEGALVTFSIANKPSWAWFDAKGGVLGGEPQAAGTYGNIVISASDGKSTVSLPAFSITAVGSNEAPKLSGNPVASIKVGSSYVFQPAASDPNGDVLAFSIANKPKWATFSTATGRLTGAPQSPDVASYAGIAISVSDGKSQATLPAFTIAVTQVAAPSASLSWTAPTQNTDGTALSDLAGYRVYFGLSADALDQVIEISNPAVASYKVENLSTGTHYFAVKAYSANGGESVKSAVASKVVL